MTQYRAAGVDIAEDGRFDQGRLVTFLD